MPYLDPQQRSAVADQARTMQETMMKAIEETTGLGFAALYTAAKSMADGFRRGLPAELVPECDELADELTQERLALCGLSKDGAN